MSDALSNDDGFGRTTGGILPAGFVLNGIYEVKRLLARGGMGEVYEGFNVNADERVAIKVILPHLAADPKVQALFRKEARTLISLVHPALVQYRVLAREPRKDLLYIVTDFIDGEPLTAVIGRGRPTASELAMLTRRLAEGLGAAHQHGVIHRDISPDNVLLPGGVLGQAKIIDFGIAKSADIGAQTVLGDGFAGKLGYVAPEQFGDFGRTVGPWTDIYSLGLVVLALAAGSAPDMGTTLVEAIDRRRAGPELSALPEVLQPLFSRMLAPNPVDRPQSMAEVIAALDAVEVPDEPPSLLTRSEPARFQAEHAQPGLGEAARTMLAPPGAEAPAWAPPPEPARTVLSPTPAPPPSEPAAEALPAQPRKGRAVMAGALGLALLLLIGGAALLMTKGRPGPTPPPSSAAAPASAAAVQSAVAAALPGVGCSWLSAHEDGSAILVAGAASDPPAAARAVAGAAEAAGGAGVRVDTTEVLVPPPALCPLLDAARAHRAASAAPAITLAQPRFEIGRDVQGCPAGLFAQSAATLATDPAKTFTVLQVEPSGRVRQLPAGEAQALGGGRYRVSACHDDQGLAGAILIQGAGPFDLGVRPGGLVRPPADFAARLDQQAKARGWTMDVALYRVVDDLPNTPAAAPARTAAAAPAPAIGPIAPAPPPPARIAPPAAAPAPATPPTATAAATAPADRNAKIPADWVPCRRYVNGAWEEAGYASEAVCIQRIFIGHCEVQTGQSGKTPLRRYNGFIQGKSGKLFGGWRNLVPAEQCPK